MNGLLIHGVFDSRTLMTLKDKGINEFSFDLRGRSFNFIPLKDLQILLGELTSEKIFLTFENDKITTINSTLNLLRNEPFKFYLIFRDQQSGAFYEEVSSPFYWMFHPEGDWKTILSLEQCKGILLPLKFQKEYLNLPELWNLTEKKNIEVYLHAETFEETLFITHSQDINLSIDLSAEVEQSYRNVDQDKLSNMKIWSRLE